MQNHQPFYHRVDGLTFLSKARTDSGELEELFSKLLSKKPFVKGSVIVEELHEKECDGTYSYEVEGLLFTAIYDVEQSEFLKAIKKAFDKKPFMKNSIGDEFDIESEPGDPADLM